MFKVCVSLFLSYKDGHKTEYPSIGVFRSSQRIIRLVCVFVQDELRQAQPGELNVVPLNSSQTENALHAIL